MVCFESTFPQHNRQFVLNGAEVLVYLVNDGWYLTNPEPKQHAKQAIFRAIEFRRPVIRCANTGISQIIDINGNPYGAYDGTSDKEVKTLIKDIRVLMAEYKQKENQNENQ